MTEYVVLLPGNEAGGPTPTRRSRPRLRQAPGVRGGARGARPQGHRRRRARPLPRGQDRPSDAAAACRVTDGPYAETVEQLTGYYLIETDDLDDLLQCVGILAEGESGIEVRALRADDARNADEVPGSADRGGPASTGTGPRGRTRGRASTALAAFDRGGRVSAARCSAGEALDGAERPRHLRRRGGGDGHRRAVRRDGRAARRLLPHRPADLDDRGRAVPAAARGLHRRGPPGPRSTATTMTTEPDDPPERPGATSGAGCWPCSSRSTAASTSPRTVSATPSRRRPGPGRGTAYPTNPPAWLLTAARRRILDRLRAEAVAARQAATAGRRGRVTRRHSAVMADAGERGGDERLRLVLLCAHPSLAPESAAALTLRLVLGVPTAGHRPAVPGAPRRRWPPG